MKKTLMIWISLLSLFLSTMANADGQPYKIAVLMWHETKHDEEALAGFKEGIELSGLAHEFDIKRAYGDQAKCRQFLRQWKTEKVDLILTIGTNGTLWAMEEVKDIPIVFAAVTNPVISGIAESWASSGRNVTGSSNWISQKQQMTAFKECVPHLKTLGVIYNSDNPVPVAEITEARKVCPSMEITLKEATIKKVEELEKAVEHLANQGIDALWVPIESLVYRNMAEVGKLTCPRKLPVLSSTLEGLGLSEETKEAQISLAAMTVDYNALGRLCVPAAIEILTAGKNPKDIPIATLPNPLIVINANASEEIGYTIPPMFLAKANTILRGFEGQKIVVAGTGDSQKLLRALAKALENKFGGGEIEVPDSIGSGGGIKSVLAGKADLARVARPLKDSERKLGLTYRLFARSPVVFVVHPGVTGIDNLTGQQVLGIYSGKITNWAQLGGKSEKIYAITRELGDSSLDVLNDNIPGFKDIVNPAAKVIYTTPEAVTALVSHSKTIGFLPLSVAKGTDLKIMKVNGIYPSAENVNDGTYAMTVPLAIVYKDEPSGLPKRFIDSLYTAQARELMCRMGAVPAQ